MRKFLIHAESLQNVFGIQDKNLKLLERQYGAEISARGNQMSVSGTPESEEKIEKILDSVAKMSECGHKLSNADIETLCRLLDSNPDIDLVDYFTSNGIKLPSKKVIRPKSTNQHKYVETIKRSDIVISIGPAGTGKTYLAMAMAIDRLFRGICKRIVLCRPALEAGEKLGFLPGDMVEKVNPYLRPLYDALFDICDYDQAQRLIEQGVIEIAPLAFMRGRTLARAFIILDEAQNTTSEQMKMFLTRIGIGSQAVITGDITQIDLPYEKISGLVEIQELFKGIDEIEFVYFDESDVVRHPIVKKIISAYQSSGEKKQNLRK